MSYQASSWAAHIPHNLVGYVAYRTLAMLADNAKEDGSAAWLEASTIAARLQISKRTVERAFNELRAARLIAYGEARHVDHLPAARRPPVYNLTMLPAAVLTDGKLYTRPTNLSAQGFPQGRQLMSLHTEEEPPLTNSTTQDNQTGHVGPVDNCVPQRGLRGHDYLPSGYCLHCGAKQIGETA